MLKLLQTILNYDILVIRKELKILDLAQEMIDYRARNKLSQMKLAELIGLNPNSICSLESRKSKARATTVSKMQKLLDEEK